MASDDIERCVVSSDVIDDLIKTSPDQMIQRLTEMIYRRFQHDMSGANMEEKLTEQQIFQLLKTFHYDFPILHLLMMNNPTPTVKLLERITQDDQIKELALMKDGKVKRNSLSRAIRYSQANVVRYIYTRLNNENLHTILCDQDKDGNTALHNAMWLDYPQFDELLKREPAFTSTQLQQLLSIKNDEGQTVDDIEVKIRPLLKRGANDQEIVQWFESTSTDDLIERLALVITRWGYKDLHRIDMAKRLNNKQIEELMKIQCGQERLPALHYLVMCSPTSLLTLLEQITDEKRLTELIFMKDSKDQRNSLSRAVEFSQTGVVRYMYTKLDENNLFKSLSDRDQCGYTPLHYAARRNYPLDELLKPFTATTSHELLSIRDDHGQTVLSYIIHQGKPEPFQTLIKTYSERQSELLALAAIQDSERNTSFHYAAGSDTSYYLTTLIQATLTPKTRKLFLTTLTIKNASEEVVKQPLQESLNRPLPANGVIYQWALESTEKHQYLLFDYPKVLVISNEAGRKEAQEAEALISCFKVLSFEVDTKTNRRKEEMLNDIKQASLSSTQSGLIVAITSHGEESFILDNDGERIDFKEVEESMTHHPPKNVPQCLIVQCCQGPAARRLNEIDKDPNAPGPPHEPRSPYAPTNRHLCVFMSTIPRMPAQRNQYVASFVKAIEHLEPDECISKAHVYAAYELYLIFPTQIPICYNLMLQKFCIKNVLPLVLMRAGIYNEVIEKNGEGDIDEQIGAVGHVDNEEESREGHKEDCNSLSLQGAATIDSKP